MSDSNTTPGLRALDDFRRELHRAAPETLDGLTLERRIHVLLNTVGCELMKEVFARADTSASEVLINGDRWGNRRSQRGKYMTTFGEVEHERGTYQQRGRGRVKVPMELRLGIVEGAYTPRAARLMAHAMAVMPTEEAEGFLTEAGVLPVSRSTLHRIPGAMAARYEGRRPEIESIVREQDSIPEEAASVQVALDGVMVPQDGEYAKARGRKTETPAPPRHEQRYGAPATLPVAANDGHEGRAWHEASVGTLHFCDAEGTPLKTIYLAQMPEPNKATLVKALGAELDAVLAERPDLDVCFASDGAPQHWTALDAMKAKLPGRTRERAMSVVDAFHVAEYLQGAAEAAKGEGTADARVLAADWRETIKAFEDGPARVLKAMRYQRSKLTGSARSQMDEAIGYVAGQNTAGRMEYATAIARNLPIGTGVVEAAAKTVVAVRMKRAGARYSQHGGQTILTFRTAVLSGRMDALCIQLGETYIERVEQLARAA